MDDRIYQILSEYQPFSFIQKKELKELCTHFYEISHDKDTILNIEGRTRIEEIYFIRKGSVELFFEKNDKRILTHYLKPGETCGGISLIQNDGVAIRTATVRENAAFIVIPKTVFLAMCDHYKAFKKFFEKKYDDFTADEAYISIVTAGKAFQYLLSTVPFSFLPEHELEEISESLSVIFHQKNTILFIQGKTPVEHLYIIQKGSAERYFEESDRKTLKSTLTEGDMYGGISMLLNDGIAIRTLETVEDSYFYAIPRKQFLKLCASYDMFSDYFTNTFGKRMLDKTYASFVTRSSHPKEDSLRFFNQHISNIFNKKLLVCDLDLSIQQAAKMMTAYHCSSIFIRSGEGDIFGVVTDNDLRKKVIASGYDIKNPIFNIMSTPLFTIPENALVFEGLLMMMKNNIKHLAVTNENGKVVGILTNRDLLTSQGQSPIFLIQEIMKADTPDKLTDKHKMLPNLIQALITNGAKTNNVTRLITTISDTLLNRFIRFAIEKIGDPPVKFSFFILGSEGRMEQTLKTDQDNAIVYEDVPDDQKEEVNAYFLKLGEEVCAWLDKSGYDFCEGGIMAKNEKWCQPLSVWKEYFFKWIRKAGPEELLKASIFFDLRYAYGDKVIFDRLVSFLFSSLTGWVGFFRNLTENALHFKPPLGFFGSFVVETKGDNKNAFDLKRAMMPIVDFARIYSLKNEIKDTNTQERLKQLYFSKVLTWEDYNEIDQAYSFMMQLRFLRQISTIVEENNKPDNYVNPKKLSRLEQTMLKEIFRKIERFQQKLNFDFIGIA